MCTPSRSSAYPFGHLLLGSRKLIAEGSTVQAADCMCRYFTATAAVEQGNHFFLSLGDEWEHHIKVTATYEFVQLQHESLIVRIPVMSSVQYYITI